MNNLATTCHKLSMMYDYDSLYTYYNNLSISYFSSCMELVKKTSIDYAMVLDNIYSI